MRTRPGAFEHLAANDAKKNSAEAILISKFYHGGVPGLMPGDFILPASVTETKSAIGRKTRSDLKRKYRTDRVYITPDLKFALFFAAMYPSGEGAVYEVEPIGEVEIDPHWEYTRIEGTPYRDTKQCEKARVISVVDVPEGMFAEARLLMAPDTSHRAVGHVELDQKRIARREFEKKQRKVKRRRH